MSRLTIILIAAVWLLLPAGLLRADEAPHARAYLDALEAGLDRIEQNMPRISNAAEVAAKRLSRGAGFGVRGDDGLASELSNRTGTLMGYDGRRGDDGDVILYVIGLPVSIEADAAVRIDIQLIKAAELKANGCVVIGLGSTDRLRRLGLMDRAIESCDAWLDNAVIEQDSKLNAPIEPVQNAAVAWTFECELFAALTRQNKVPVVQKSFEIDTLRKRWYRYGVQHFHHDRWLDPIDAGSLGRIYLKELDTVLLDIGTSSWRAVAKTANRAYTTRTNDGTIWLRAGGRSLPYHSGSILKNDPGIFTLLTHDGSNPKLPAPGNNDMLIAVGDHETAGSWEWGEPELLRKAGRGVTWIVNGYNTQRADLDYGEVMIDLWAPVGDSVVRIKNYDANLGPVSGITSEAVTWMIAAEVAGRMQE